MTEQEFVAKALREWSSDVERELRKMLVKHDHRVTGELLASVGSFARPWDTDIMFDEVGRFVDMGVGRSAAGETIESNGYVYAAMGKRRRDPWYSRTAYGMLNALIDEIQFGYGTEALDVMKKPLQEIAD